MYIYIYLIYTYICHNFAICLLYCCYIFAMCLTSFLLSKNRWSLQASSCLNCLQRLQSGRRHAWSQQYMHNT